MNKIVIMLAACSVVFACEGDSEAPIDPPQCETYAVIRDMTGLDGCGFVFELEDGTYVEPLRMFYDDGTSLLPEPYPNDPLLYFEFAEGKRIMFGYEDASTASGCMVGPVVRVTCIESLDTTVDHSL